MTIDRLFVLWSAPDRGARHVVGHLSRDHGEFRFWYEERRQESESAGFRPLAVFPEIRGETDPYRARYLFTTFADRVPSPERTDAKAMMASWGVERADDQFEVLARSGGIRATDRLELAEYRSAFDPLEAPLEFRIAGGKHVPPQDRAVISVGERLELRREPSNAYDSAATLVVASTGQKAGYVPRQYSEMVARLLDANIRIAATALRELAVPDDVGRWVVRAERI